MLRRLKRYGDLGDDGIGLVEDGDANVGRLARRFDESEVRAIRGGLGDLLQGENRPRAVRRLSDEFRKGYGRNELTERPRRGDVVRAARSDGRGGE